MILLINNTRIVVLKKISGTNNTLTSVNLLFGEDFYLYLVLLLIDR